MRHKITSVFSGKIMLVNVLLAGLLVTATGCQSALPPQETTYPVILEIIQDIPDSVMLALSAKYGIDPQTIYGWNGRRLIYDLPEEAQGVKTEIQSLYPEALLQQYENPYYIFDRSRCGDEPITTPLAHKILTANLVEDLGMQQEYMDYHKNQFEQFPEVSAGFCRAEFQRLIMYRVGRQLMLIISYPAGKDYDTLNARTVTDNPRVDEWNSIMGQYQEGVDGTAPDETWVFFEPVF